MTISGNFPDKMTDQAECTRNPPREEDKPLIPCRQEKTPAEACKGNALPTASSDSYAVTQNLSTRPRIELLKAWIPSSCGAGFMPKPVCAFMVSRT